MHRLIALSRALSYSSMPGDGHPLPHERRWATERPAHRHGVLLWTSNHPSIDQRDPVPGCPDDLSILDISPEYQSDFVEARTLHGFDKVGVMSFPCLEIANPVPHCPFTGPWLVADVLVR